MTADAMKPYGLALKAYAEGQTAAELIIRRDDGVEAKLPAKHYFRVTDEFTPIENAALSHCRGHILDIGAGAGIHSLALQSTGLDVTALDISPEAVSVMVKRGVNKAQLGDIYTYSGGPFDTLLLLGHGIGMTGDLKGLDKFLTHARHLLNRRGQILLDSMDVAQNHDPENVAYHETNRRAGRYIGEVRMQIEFEGIQAPFESWLHVDSRTLESHARQAGWKCDILIEQENGEYLARFEKA